LTFGDSRTGQATWPYILTRYIEEDLGVDVHLNNQGIGGQTSERLLGWLQDREQYIRWIREAEIVIILTMNEAGYARVVRNNFSGGCASEEYEIILEDIIKEILTIREGNPLIFHLLEHYNYPGNSAFSTDYFTDRTDCFEQYNQAIHNLAEKYKLTVIPVYEAFNGPTGTENPDDKGYLDDGLHLSPDGDAVIADLIMDLGFESLFP